jgi:cysteine synthase
MPAAKRNASTSATANEDANANDSGNAATVLAAIGNTPLVRLRAPSLAPENGAELWVKLEYLNPTGSMKDRMALAMIEGAERDARIAPGMTVVEYTGGSTGPALALVCRAKGYRAKIVISDCFSEERLQLMRALGAELEVLPAVEERGRVTAQDIHNMVERAAELAREPDTYATDQFNNPYVVPDHKERLGGEIWEQTHGRVAAFCHGIGTSGSLMGVSQALKERDRAIRVVALEPAGSAAISGGRSGSFAMQGWTGIVPPHFERERVDDVWTIEDDEAIETTAKLAQEEGIFAGVSSGANVVGARRLAAELGPEAVVVTLAVDSGFKYMTGAPYAQL